MKKLLKLSVLFLFITHHYSLYAACTPAATGGDDSISCTGTISGTYALRTEGGSDSVLLTDVTGNGVFWLDESIAGNPLTDSNDTFIARNSIFYWVFMFGGDDHIKIYDSNFSNVYADTNPNYVTQRGNDTIYIENAMSNGWILGGNDNDQITIKDSNVSFVAAGYSDIYGAIDYTPFDGNDTIILDHVGFTVSNYYYTTRPGAVEGGKADDTIRFIHGGEAKNVTGGHGNDLIEIYDGVHFTPCVFTNDIGGNVTCGIYGDEPYISEPNATRIPLLHGDDHILISDADIKEIMVHGGDGSDGIRIETPVLLDGTILDGGDDKSIIDGFVDVLLFDQWSGELNGSLIQHWESIVLDTASHIQFIDTNISVGFEDGIDLNTGYPYGLILQNSSILDIDHSFAVEGNLHNNAIVDLQDGMTDTVLHVSNDYRSEGGDIYLDVTLNDASIQLADILVVGRDTVGESTLYIDNIGGLGAQTPTGDDDGILVVVVNGTSNATFVLNDILTSGEYLYKLHKSSQGNWYLRSEKIDPTITLLSEANITEVSDPEWVHIKIILENTGNIPLTGVVVNNIFPDASHDFLVLQSGDINQNGILDVGEVWIYGVDYYISQIEVDAGIDLVNKALIYTDQMAVASENTVINIHCACESIRSDSGNSMKMWVLFLMLSLFLRLAKREEINSF